MRKVEFCYDQIKKREILPRWKTKNTSHFDHRRRGFKSNKSFWSKSQNFSKNNYQKTNFKNKILQNTAAPKRRDISINFVKNTEQREPVKCWECQEPHYAKYCTNQKGNISNIYTIQEEETVGDVANEMHKINIALENRRADHQTSMVEVKGMIQNFSISILIDRGVILSYISPSIVEK